MFLTQPDKLYSKNNKPSGAVNLRKKKEVVKMGKGKYQKILEKTVLSYDDLLVLSDGKKIKGIYGAMVIIRHNKENYLKLVETQ